MHTKRIIPCLDVKAGRVVKGTNFVGLQDAGDPVELAHIYDEERARRLVDAIIADYIPEFERANQGLVARYGEALND